MAKRLIPATGRRLAALALLAALCACASTSAEPRTEARPAGWRIVEQTGAARYSPPGAAVWTTATTGQGLADGSEVTTGRGGRLTVAMPDRHISAGPGSHFVLPSPDWDERLEQRAGWLRYRIAEAEAQPFRIHTRSLELELLAGVVDVHVKHLATEVTVKEGQVRVATPDGLRQSQMMAGQAAHAGGSDGMELAVRLSPGAPLEPVDPVIIPALQPKSTPAWAPRASAPSGSPSAVLPAPAPGEAAITPPPTDHAARAALLLLRQAGATRTARSGAAGNAAAQPAQALPRRPGAASRQPAAVVAATAQREAARPGAPDRDTRMVKRRPAESDAAAIRRGKFERLTAGMIEGVEPPYPAPIRW